MGLMNRQGALFFEIGRLDNSDRRNGNIQGTLTDPSGAVVPTETETLTNESTRLTRTSRSDIPDFTRALLWTFAWRLSMR